MSELEANVSTHAESAVNESLANRSPAPLPLVFDLDRTLIRTDAGVESLVNVLARQPLWIFSIIAVFLTGGLAAAKRWIVKHVVLRPELAPINPSVVDYAREQAELGRVVVLVTASDQAIADAFGNHFGFFSEVIGSNGSKNLKGANKAAYLVERFGERGFVYVGDSSADLHVWEKSGGAVVVEYSSAQRRLHQAQQKCPIEAVFPVRSAPRERSLWMRQLRVHQWAKNLLLVVPLLLAHQLLNVAVWTPVIWGFVVFSMLASSVYILNDLSDLEADRRHRTKRSRPLAAGLIRIEHAFFVASLLILGAVVLVSALVPQIGLIALSYFLLTSVYSWWGKEQLALDIVLLSALYCIRIIAGGVAAGVAVSPWLLMFAGFIFVSLACVKRVAELTRQAEDGSIVKSGRRAYTRIDIPVLTQLGVGSGLLSVLVCAFYFSGPDVMGLYARPEILVAGVLPIIFFWVARLWLLVHRPLDVDLEDPVLFAISDRVSLVCAAISGVLVWLAT